MTKKEYDNKCFSPNWLEIDISNDENNTSRTDNQTVKETYQESYKRKNLNTLLKELNEIKENIEKVAEKQHRLANLMSFYTGEFAK